MQQTSHTNNFFSFHSNIKFKKLPKLEPLIKQINQVVPLNTQRGRSFKCYLFNATGGQCKFRRKTCTCQECGGTNAFVEKQNALAHHIKKRKRKMHRNKGGGRQLSAMIARVPPKIEDITNLIPTRKERKAKTLLQNQFIEQTLLKCKRLLTKDDSAIGYEYFFANELKIAYQTQEFMTILNLNLFLKFLNILLYSNFYKIIKKLFALFLFELLVLLYQIDQTIIFLLSLTLIHSLLHIQQNFNYIIQQSYKYLNYKFKQIQQDQCKVQNNYKFELYYTSEKTPTQIKQQNNALTISQRTIDESQMTIVKNSNINQSQVLNTQLPRVNFKIKQKPSLHSPRVYQDILQTHNLKPNRTLDKYISQSTHCSPVNIQLPQISQKKLTQTQRKKSEHVYLKGSPLKLLLELKSQILLQKKMSKQ